MIYKYIILNKTTINIIQKQGKNWSLCLKIEFTVLLKPAEKGKKLKGEYIRSKIYGKIGWWIYGDINTNINITKTLWASSESWDVDEEVCMDKNVFGFGFNGVWW